MSGTSISERLDRLGRLLDRLGEPYGVCLRLAEIMGKRWSHVAGRFEADLPPLPPVRIPVTDRYGVLADGWDRVPEGDRTRILDAIRRAVQEGSDDPK